MGVLVPHYCLFSLLSNDLLNVQGVNFRLKVGGWKSSDNAAHPIATTLWPEQSPSIFFK